MDGNELGAIVCNTVGTSEGYMDGMIVGAIARFMVAVIDRLLNFFWEGMGEESEGCIYCDSDGITLVKINNKK